MLEQFETKHVQPNAGSKNKHQPKFIEKPIKSKIISNICILTEHDQIVEAFHNKYKCEEGKRWLLKEEDLPEVVAAVNNYGLDDWMKVAWAVQATMVRSNLKKGNKKIPN